MWMPTPRPYQDYITIHRSWPTIYQQKISLTTNIAYKGLSESVRTPLQNYFLPLNF